MGAQRNPWREKSQVVPYADMPKPEAGEKLDMTSVGAPQMKPEARSCKWERGSHKLPLKTSFKGKQIS